MDDKGYILSTSPFLPCRRRVLSSRAFIYLFSLSVIFVHPLTEKIVRTTMYKKYFIIFFKEFCSLKKPIKRMVA